MSIQCTECEQWKPQEAFGTSVSHHKGVRYETPRRQCKACRAKQKRVWHLENKYGLSKGQYEEMLTCQGGVCAICGGDASSDRWNTFHVDHDHETGAVRGLLCNNCNSGLGRFKDDAGRLEKAIAYLKRHSDDIV